MLATVTARGRTYKTVTVAAVKPSDTDEEVKAAALLAAGETRSSVFNIRLMRTLEGHTATVRIDTD